MGRMLGQSYVSGITVRVADDTPMSAAEQAVTKLMQLRHGRKDFFLNNTSDIRETIESTTRNITLLDRGDRSDCADRRGHRRDEHQAGVGDRAHKGDRRANGGWRAAGDIMQQFLIEAVLVCLIGGLFGILLAYGLGHVAEAGERAN